ncbi:MAG: toll/interleukin-1 receptor domain-containing protein [Gemmatimonadetes bacterium]|nr:toll/interleukin-1 receptor domain-containing protein [Gemmatimonadota bacterium]
MARIFISYRRDDSAGHAGRLADVLLEAFGPGSVFRDVDAIGPGEDFVVAIRDAIAACDAVLVVIGRDWLSARNPGGQRRLDDEGDHVRREIAAALAREIRIVPLLVEGARMPGEAELPAELAALARRNALVLGESTWTTDVERLLGALRDVAPTDESVASAGAPARRVRSRRVHPVAGIGIVAIAALILVIVLIQTRDATDGVQTGDSAATDPVNPDVAVESRPLDLPANLAFELALAVFEIRGARVERSASGSALVLDVRFTNHASADDSFRDDSFALDFGGVSISPISQLNLRVGAQSTADGTVRFPIPGDAPAVSLRLRHHAEVATAGIDLRPGRLATPGVDGPGVVAIDPGGPARFQLDDMGVEVTAIRVQRYVNKNVLVLTLRVTHDEGPPDRFSDRNLRLDVERRTLTPEVPMSLLLPAAATADGDVMFELDPAVRIATVRIEFGERTGVLPLDLSPAAR